jgi:hypothetical protein
LHQFFATACIDALVSLVQQDFQAFAIDGFESECGVYFEQFGAQRTDFADEFCF